MIKADKVLLVKRRYPPGQGLWAIPGGRVRLGETLEMAAEREVLEETGVATRARNPVYVFDLIERDNADHIRFHYVIIDLMADYVSGKPYPGDDASEARWLTWEELERLRASETTIEVLRKLLPWTDTQTSLLKPLTPAKKCLENV